MTRVHSVAGVLGAEPIARARPFRAPHHSISAAGLVGGGAPPTPGEVEPRPARRPVPRRAGGVLAARARGAAPAAGGGLRAHHPGAAHGHAFRPGSCSWARAIRVPAATTATRAATARCPRAGARALPRQAQRRAARPHRHRAARSSSRRARSCAPRRSRRASAAIRARVVAARARQHERLRGHRGRAATREMSPAELRRLCRSRQRRAARARRRARSRRPHACAATTARCASRARSRTSTAATWSSAATSRRRSPTGRRVRGAEAPWRLRRCLRRGRAAGPARAMDRAGAERAAPRARGARAVQREAGRRGVRGQARAGRRVHGAVRRRRSAARGVGARACGRCAAHHRGYPVAAADLRTIARRAVPEGRREHCSNCWRTERAGRDRRLAAGVGVRAARSPTRSAASLPRPRVPVVSGLAFGVDAAAHEGALAGRGPAVVVMPSGADVAYPRSQRALHRRLCERGLVVSELPPGHAPAEVVLPGAQPDHGRASPHMTVVVEGTADVGLADHGAASRRTSAARWARSRARSRRPGGRAATRCSPTAPAWSARPPTCSTRCTGRAPASGSVPWRREPLRAAAGAAARGRRGRAGRRRDRARRGAEVGDVLAGLTELELLGLVRRGPGGAYVRGTGTGVPMLDGDGSGGAPAFRACCRSPGPTRAAAPGSRPT